MIFFTRGVCQNQLRTDYIRTYQPLIKANKKSNDAHKLGGVLLLYDQRFVGTNRLGDLFKLQFNNKGPEL